MNVFTVSPRHPKLSFVSKISPSPDWFTGTFFVYWCATQMLFTGLLCTIDVFLSIIEGDFFDLP